MRHEEKYICSGRQLLLIEQRLKSVMKHDSNQKGEDYRIRSLYLDTNDERLYKEGINGVDNRKKYRIRFYNMNDAFIRIERKDTVGRMKQKYSALVKNDDVRTVVEGGILPDKDDDLIREVRSRQMTERMHPVVIVDYRRSAYTYPFGNVRITFDRDISYTPRIGEFYDDHALLFPVLPYDRHILEVKYDGILPGFIAKLADIGDLEQVSFSKYVHARSLMDGNGRLETGYEL